MGNKVPLRMCVVCRQMKPKQELIRIVKTTDGQVLLDKTLKAAGRGAYVCRAEECLQKCIKTKALNRAFKGQVAQQNYDMLLELSKSKEN